MSECARCGKVLNPVEVILGTVCGYCARISHAQTTGQPVSRLTDITRIASRDAREGHYRPPVYCSAFERDRYKLVYLHALWRRRIHVS